MEVSPIRFCTNTRLYTDRQRNEAHTAVKNVAESLADRPVQQVGEDSNLAKERTQPDILKQKDKDR